MHAKMNEENNSKKQRGPVVRCRVRRVILCAYCLHGTANTCADSEKYQCEVSLLETQHKNKQRNSMQMGLG